MNETEVRYEVVLGYDIKIYINRSVYHIECSPIRASGLHLILKLHDNSWYKLSTLATMLLNYVHNSKKNIILYDKMQRTMELTTNSMIKYNGNSLRITRRNIEFVVINCCNNRFDSIPKNIKLSADHILKHTFEVYHNISYMLSIMKLTYSKDYRDANTQLQEIVFDRLFHILKIVYKNRVYVEYTDVKHINNRNFPQPENVYLYTPIEKTEQSEYEPIAYSTGTQYSDTEYSNISLMSSPYIAKPEATAIKIPVEVEFAQDLIDLREDLEGNNAISNTQWDVQKEDEWLWGLSTAPSLLEEIEHRRYKLKPTPVQEKREPKGTALEESLKKRFKDFVSESEENQWGEINESSIEWYEE